MELSSIHKYTSTDTCEREHQQVMGPHIKHLPSCPACPPLPARWFGMVEISFRLENFLFINLIRAYTGWFEAIVHKIRSREWMRKVAGADGL